MNRIFSALLFAGGMLAASMSSAARSDLNGDGRSDLLWYHSGVFGLVSMPANGLSLAPLDIVDIRPNADWQIRGVADLNGDGEADVVWRNKATGEVHALLMNGPAVLGQGTILTLPSLEQDIAAVTDINGDGKADLVVSDLSTGALSVTYLNGLTPVLTASVEIGANPARRILASGDLNGDGKKELFWRDDASGALYATFLGAPANPANAASGNDVRFYFEPNQNWQTVGFDDFNGDGKTDVLWRNTATGDVYLMTMNGVSITGGSFIYTEPSQDWRIVATGDYDGDGRADIVWRNMANGATYMMLMNGLTIASQGFVYFEPDMQWQIVGNVLPPVFRNMVKAYGDPKFTLTPPISYSTGAFTYTSSNNNIAGVSGSGQVTIKDVGAVTITAVQAATARFPEIRTTATLTVEKGVTKIVSPDAIDEFFQQPIEIPFLYSMDGFHQGEPEEYVVPSATLSDTSLGGLSWDENTRGRFYFSPSKSGAATVTFTVPERLRWKAAVKTIPVNVKQRTASASGPRLLSVSGVGNPADYTFDAQTATVTLKMCPPGSARSNTETIRFAFSDGAQGVNAMDRAYLNGFELAKERIPGLVFTAAVSNTLGTALLKRVSDPYVTTGTTYTFDDFNYTVNVEFVSNPSQTTKCLDGGPQ